MHMHRISWWVLDYMGWVGLGVRWRWINGNEFERLILNIWTELEWDKGHIGWIEAVFPVNGKLERKCREGEEIIYKMHYHRIYICNSIQRIFFVLFSGPATFSIKWWFFTHSRDVTVVLSVWLAWCLSLVVVGYRRMAGQQIICMSSCVGV